MNQPDTVIIIDGPSSGVTKTTIRDPGKVTQVEYSLAGNTPATDCIRQLLQEIATLRAAKP